MATRKFFYVLYEFLKVWVGPASTYRVVVMRPRLGSFSTEILIKNFRTVYSMQLLGDLKGHQYGLRVHFEASPFAIVMHIRYLQS